MPRPVDEPLRNALANARVPSIAAAREWRASGAWTDVSRRFAVAGTLAEAEAVAAAMLLDLGWVERLLVPLIKGLAADPLFEAPIRAHRDGLRTGAVLYEDSRVAITATVMDHASSAARANPDSVVVSGRVAWTRYVRAGGATLRRWRADRVGDSWTAACAKSATVLPPAALRDGAIVRHDGRSDAMLISDARGDVVSLAITLKMEAAPLMREYAANTGRLLRIATLDDRAARCAMLLTVLRELGHADGQAFDDATRDPAFFLRWDAMRDWLASDAMSALPRLRAMATGDPHPEIRDAAAAMVPRVEQLMAQRCPA